MKSRQTGKTKLQVCVALGIDTKTLDAYIDMVNNDKETKGDKNEKIRNQA